MYASGREASSRSWWRGREGGERTKLGSLPSFLPLLLFSPSSKKNNRDHTHNISRSSSRTVSLLHTFRGGAGVPREREEGEREGGRGLKRGEAPRDSLTFRPPQASGIRTVAVSSVISVIFKGTKSSRYLHPVQERKIFSLLRFPSLRPISSFPFDRRRKCPHARVLSSVSLSFQLPFPSKSSIRTDRKKEDRSSGSLE